MQRDMELVRKILRGVQAKNDLSMASFEIEGYEEWFVQRHLELLLEAGLLDGVVSRPLGHTYPLVMAKDLTMAGHDFAAAVLNDNAWGQLKQKLSIAELATMPLKIAMALSQGVLEAYLKAKMGLN